jgi:amidase
VDDALAFTSATKQAAMIRAGDVSPGELVDGYLERIAAFDTRLHSFITVAAEQAREGARAAEARLAHGRAGDLPPFLGVPISIKDFVDTAGIRTTRGTRAWAERVPDDDAEVVRKLRAAGFVIIGKTNIPELTGGTYIQNDSYGACRNPWDLSKSCGGSSHGAAAALAAGLCAVSHATDDGGSVRIPASYTGLVGIKPSRGRVSAAPEPQAMEYTGGVIARTVADTAATLDAMSGYVAGDAFWAPPPLRPFADEVGRDPGRLRIAFLVRGGDTVHIDEDHVAAVRRTAAALEAAGHELVELDDWPGRGLFPDDRIMPLHEMYGAQWAGLVSQGLLPPADQLEPTNRGLVEAGFRARACDYLMANRLAQLTARRVVAFLQSYDMLLTPVMACPAPEIDAFTGNPEALAVYLSAVQFTAQFNVTGQPAIDVPAGLDRRGMPVGVQLAGLPADEAALFRVAAQLETVQPWADLRPSGFIATAASTR